MSKYIVLARGLPGSGKTSLTEMIGVPSVSGIMTRPVSCSADDFFVDNDGQYNFDPKLLPDAHQSCQDKARNAMQAGKSVAVHNTFTQRWEMEPYLQMAEEFGYRVIVASVYDGGCDNDTLARRNTHGVPVESIAAMRNRWEVNWQEGDTRPPWLRE